MDNGQSNNQNASPFVGQVFIQNAPVQGQEPAVQERSGGGKKKSLLKIAIGFIFLLILIPVIYLIVSMFSNKGVSGGTGGSTLEYWGLWEDPKVMAVIIEDFEKQNPNVKINYTKQDIKQYRETLTTRIENGNGPDIVTFHNTWYPMLASVLLPLPTSTITNEEFKNNFYPVAQKDLIHGGAIYGIPSGIDTLAMYINKDLFSASGVNPPKNWNDFVNASRVLTVKDENGKIKTAGAALGTYKNINHAPDILSLLFIQNGVDLSNLEASKDRIVGTFTFYSSFASGTENVWDDTLDPSLLAFSKGNLAMYFGYSKDYFEIKSFNPNLAFEVLPIPQLSDTPVNIASYWAVGVSAKSKSQSLALKFIKYLSQKATYEKLYAQASKVRAFGEPYPRIDLANSLSGNLDVYPFVSQAQSATSTFFVSDTNDGGINQQLNTLLEKAITSFNSGESTDDVFDAFSQGYYQVMQQYGQQ